MLFGVCGDASRALSYTSGQPQYSQIALGSLTFRRKTRNAHFRIEGAGVSARAVHSSSSQESPFTNFEKPGSAGIVRITVAKPGPVEHQEMLYEDIAGEKGCVRRSSHPLAEAPTPYNMRRFFYQHLSGKPFLFDEQLLGTRGALTISSSTSAKRSQPQQTEVDGPAPKRREFDVEDLVLGGERGLPAPTTPEPLPPAPLPQEQAQEFQDPAAAIRVVHRSRRERRSSGNIQPTLLSPTASPRSPPSPSSPDYADNDVADQASSPPYGSLSSAAPPSARAYAPLPTALSGPASPNNFSLLQQHMLGPQSQTSVSSTQPMIGPAVLQDTLREQLLMIENTFEKLPPAIHRYALFSLFRGCNRNTLSTLCGELERALRFDILSQLPPELCTLVLSKLDVKSVVAASEVSRSWYKIIDRDESLWQHLLEREALHPTAKDYQCARTERWGYTGWATLINRPAVQPLNAFNQPINLHKAVYRRLALININWMSPDIEPRRKEIQCPYREVVTCLDFSEDIIIASTDGSRHLNVYDTQSGVLLHEFTSHEGGVWALKRIGKDTIVSGSTDHTVRVWSLSKNRCTHVFRGHHATVRCLDVVMPEPGLTNRDYPLILTGSRDTTMRIWKLPRPEDEDFDSKAGFLDTENPFFVAELRGHEDSVRAVCGYGDIAVSGSYDNRVRVWDLTTHRCKHILKGHENKVYATIIDAERNRCISASMDYQIKIWDLDTGAQLYTLEGHTGLVGLLGLYDNTLVSAAADKTLRIWNPENGHMAHCLAGHDSAILCFDHDKRRIVSGSEKHLKLWNTQTGAFARDLLTDIDRIWQVSFDRRRCVAAVARGQNSFLEIMDFDFEPPPPKRITQEQDSAASDEAAVVPSDRTERQGAPRDSWIWVE